MLKRYSPAEISAFTRRLAEINERALHEQITTAAHIDRDFLLTLVKSLLEDNVKLDCAVSRLNKIIDDQIAELNAANPNQTQR